MGFKAEKSTIEWLSTLIIYILPALPTVVITGILLYIMIKFF